MPVPKKYVPKKQTPKKKKWWEHVGDAFDDAFDSTTDLVKEGKCYRTITKVKDSGTECYVLATETRDLCEATQTKSQEMITFGSEIKSTLDGFSGKMDAETLETIKDLMDGDRLASAMDLAKGMDDIAISCVDKSVRMLEIMEDVMDSVPDGMERLINKAAGPDDAEAQMAVQQSTMVLSTLDQDIEDVNQCLTALKELNLSTALKVGVRAFQNLSSKASIARVMFDTISLFSKEVASYTQAIHDGDVGDMFKLASKLKHIWHCLKLANLMRQLAEGAGTLIRLIIDLFSLMSDRLSTLWAALAFAKDCMVDCMQYVLDCKNLVLDANEKSVLLIKHSKSISRQLQDFGDFNKKSIDAARNLTRGGEIKQAIQLATTMDDLVLECSGKVVSMVERVTEGFQNLPDIIVEGIDVQEEGKMDGDPEPDDIESNVRELVKSREIIESSDIITACRASVGGFKSVLDNEDICQEMLQLVHGFTGNCSETIEAFLGVWDLDSAMEKITEMCRIVRLGELIKQFAEQIKKLLKAIIAFMAAALEKLKVENLAKMDLGEVADGAIDAVKDSFQKMFKK